MVLMLDGGPSRFRQEGDRELFLGLGVRSITTLMAAGIGYIH